jgi:hypothetical protein
MSAWGLVALMQIKGRSCGSSAILYAGRPKGSIDKFMWPAGRPDAVGRNPQGDQAGRIGRLGPP